MTDERDSAGVRFPPPLIFVIALIISGFLTQFIAPVNVDAWLGDRFVRGFGILLIFLGLLLVLWALGTFKRAGTAIIPTHTTTQVVERGPYLLTRNPMYLAMTAIYLGIGAAASWGWVFILLPVVITSVYMYVIRKEERYLEGKFGQQYLDYKRRVRRWL